MSAQPEPSLNRGTGGPSTGSSRPDATDPASPAAAVLSWRPRSPQGLRDAQDRPTHAPGDRLGSARGLLLGLLFGVLLWSLIGLAVWRVLL